jgi:hypothetical protein
MTPSAAIRRLQAMVAEIRRMPACGRGNLAYVVRDLTEDIAELKEWQRFAIGIGKDSEWLPKTWKGVLAVAENWADGTMETTWSNAVGIVRKMEQSGKDCGRR